MLLNHGELMKQQNPFPIPILIRIRIPIAPPIPAVSVCQLNLNGGSRCPAMAQKFWPGSLLKANHMARFAGEVSNKCFYEYDYY